MNSASIDGILVKLLIDLIKNYLIPAMGDKTPSPTAQKFLQPMLVVLSFLVSALSLYSQGKLADIDLTQMPALLSALVNFGTQVYLTAMGAHFLHKRLELTLRQGAKNSDGRP